MAESEQVQAGKQPGEIGEKQDTASLRKNVAAITQWAEGGKEQGEGEPAEQSKSQPPDKDRGGIGEAILRELHAERRRLLIVGDLLRREQQRTLRSGQPGDGRRQFHPLQQQLIELAGCVRVRIVAHKDTHVWMVENGVALVGAAVIERDAKEIRVVLELRGEAETKLATEQQLVIMNSQRIAGRQARNGFIEPIGCHCDNINGWQQVCQHLRLLNGVVSVEVEAGLGLFVRVKIRGLLVG